MARPSRAARRVRTNASHRDLNLAALDVQADRPALLWLPTILAIALGSAFLLGYRADVPLSVLTAKYANEDSRFVEVLGTRIHYREHGEGPGLLLLHDAGSSLHAWDGWIDTLAYDFRVVRLDLPGFGLTGPPASEDYGIASYTRIVGTFARQVGLERFGLVGHGLGGEIAWNFAAEQVDRVPRLVLISPSGYPRGVDRPPWVLRTGRIPGIAWLTEVLTPRTLMESALRRAVATPDTLSEELIDRYYDLSLRPGNRRARIERALVGWQDENAGRHRLVSQPTLLLWGMEDRQAPLGDARGFVDEMQDARLLSFPGVGHMVPEELPQQTARAALAFLRDRPALNAH